MNVIEIYVKRVESVLNRFLSKKYDWFDRIILKGIGYEPGPRGHVAFEGTIFVDPTWLYKQWREYHYETPFPDLKDQDLDISFGDFIGGNFSKKLKDEFIMIFTTVTLVPRPNYISWSWINVETVEKQNEDDSENDLRENIKKTLKEELDPTIKLRRLLHNIDNELEYQVRHYYKPHHLCYYKSAKEFFNVVFHAVIEHSYYDYFSDMDDLSKEWRMIYDMMHDYIKEKYGKRLEDYYHINCGD